MVLNQDKDEKKRPLFLFLCITSLLAALTSFLLAAWLIDASRFAQNANDILGVMDEDPQASDNNTPNQSRLIAQCMMTIGCLTVVFALVLLSNAIEYLLIVHIRHIAIF